MPRIALVLSILLTLVASAHASLSTVLVGTPAPTGPNFAFNYNLLLPPNEQFNLSQTSPYAPDHDFLTIYDIPGFVSATAPAGWSAITHLLGLTPDHVLPPDSPTATNVTFTYTGSDILGGASGTLFTGFQIVSTFGAIQTKGSYTSQDTDIPAGDIVQAWSLVAIPASVPEPGSLSILACATVFLGRRRSFQSA